VCVASFSGRRRAAVRRALGPTLATSVGPVRTALWRLGGALPAGLGAAVVEAGLRGAAAVQVPLHAGPITVVTEHSIERAHAAGVQVHAWTINDRTEMHRLLDLGVDALITDRADIVREVLKVRGQWRA
jgi:glycerophosphoryl diester phosphodiesterase